MPKAVDVSWAHAHAHPTPSHPRARGGSGSLTNCQQSPCFPAHSYPREPANQQPGLLESLSAIRLTDSRTRNGPVRGPPRVGTDPAPNG